MGTDVDNDPNADLGDIWDALAAPMAEGVRLTIALDSGMGDEWAWAIGHWFGIAHALEWHGEEIPAEWEFRNPMGPQPPEDYPDVEYSRGLEFGEFSGDDLRKAGDIMGAYLEILRARGMDY